ncbi:MAG TPA: hypothetical protein VJX67_10235, partial [Blastocatellia bacterium]|nr:hypothetical protein [Blastocatellia bacterium]
APNPSSDEQPVSIEVEFSDQQVTRVGLTIWDQVDDVTPYAHFNAMPDPMTNPEIPFQAWIGWEEETPVKVLDGYLAAKKLHYPGTICELLGTHQAIKLRKRARADSRQNMTVLQFLQTKAKEEKCQLVVDASAAGDEALAEPCDVILQLAHETNWDIMRTFIKELGYVTVPEGANVLRLFAHKLNGPEVTIERWDGQMINQDARFEQRKAGKSSHRRGHLTEISPGKFQHNTAGQDQGQSRGKTSVPPVLPRSRKSRKGILGVFNVRGVARRLEHEGNELTMTTRLRPEMKNQEKVTLKGFGPEMDGTWQTASIVHRIGHGAAETQMALWRQR